MEKERDNFFRFICLMVEVVPVILRFRLKQSYKNSNLPTLHSFLKDTDVLHTFFHLFFPAYFCCWKGCGIQRDRPKGFSKEQWNIFYDADSTRCCKQNLKDPYRICICCVTPKDINESILDLSLLSLILNNCCSLMPFEKEAVQTIRDMKNKYVSHNSGCSLSNSDFENLWQKAEFCIKHLDSTNIYLNQRENLLRRPMDESLMQQYFAYCCETTKIKHLEAEIKDIHASIITGHAKVIEILQTLQSSFDDQQRESNNAVEGLPKKRKLNESIQCSIILTDEDNTDDYMPVKKKLQKLERLGMTDDSRYKLPEAKPFDNYKEYISSDLLGSKIPTAMKLKMDYKVFTVKDLSSQPGFQEADKFLCGKCGWVNISLYLYLKHVQQCEIRQKENEHVKDEYRKYVVARVIVPTTDKDLSSKIEKEWRQGNLNPQHSSLEVTYITTGCVVIWVKVDVYLFLNINKFYSALDDLVYDIFQKYAVSLPFYRVQVYDIATGYVDNLTDEFSCGDCKLTCHTLDHFISHKKTRCFRHVISKTGETLQMDVNSKQHEDLFKNIEPNSSANFKSGNKYAKSCMNNIQKEQSLTIMATVQTNVTLTAWIGNIYKLFIITRSAKYVYKHIQGNSYLMNNAHSGEGKKITLHQPNQIAFKFGKEGILGMCVSLVSDAVGISKPKRKTLIGFFDKFGNLNQSQINRLKQSNENMKQTLHKIQIKIFEACLLKALPDEMIGSICKPCACKLIAKYMSSNAKKCATQWFLKSKASDIFYFFHLLGFFLRVCKLCPDNPDLRIFRSILLLYIFIFI